MNIIVSDELGTSTHVFARRDKVKPYLRPPYDGPFWVLPSKEKIPRINFHKFREIVITNPFKCAYLPASL